MKLFLQSIGNFLPWPQRRWPWGQAIVEFALLLPVLLLIILVIVEAAFVIQGYLTVQHAAREAVRWAITYQPVQRQRLDGEYCADLSAGDSIERFLFTDAGYNCDPTEDEEEYNNRRIALMKETALERAAGLRVKQSALGLTEEAFDANLDEAGFLGVRVWGFPSFDEEEQLDHPGLPGLPVRVLVAHNVEILDPFFRLIATYVPVSAQAEMLNEGVQVGRGNVPPPTFNPTVIYGTPSVEPTTEPTIGPPVSPTPPLTPLSYRVEISFDYVTNTLPLQRGHDVPVTVTDGDGNPVPEVTVSFSTDMGSYDYSGQGSQYAEAPTDQDGVAIRTVYANDAGSAVLRAWIDLDGDNGWDSPGEPVDTALKEWGWPGENVPYVVPSHYVVVPLDWITVDVYNHPPSDNPYTLLWCRTSITGGITSTVLLAGSIYVDTDTWDALDLPVQIPAGSAGDYRLETHTDVSTCGDPTTLVAYSADIRAMEARPDLSVVSFGVPAEIQPTTVFTMSVTIENLSRGSTTEMFDVDFYLDPDGEPPQGRMGVIKQWISGIGPLGTVVVNTVMWVDTVGVHEVWVRVDTGDYVQEDHEDNNVGMVTIVAVCPLEEHDGQVVIPAGMFSSIESGSCGGTAHEWGLDAYNGTDTMLALPDAGDGCYDYRGAAGAPLIRYDVYFEHPGTYYVWALGRPCSETPRRCYQGGVYNDSFWVTLDGAPDANDNYRITGWGPGGFSWISEIHGASGQPYLDVLSAGHHQVQVRMREDGFEWATIVLTTTADADGEPIGEDLTVSCGSDDPPPWDPGTLPGLADCTQLIEAGGFEGNLGNVFRHWRAGGTGSAWQRTGSLQYEGAFSMRLLASLGSYPACHALDPWLYQTVQIPTDVSTETQITVDGWRAVGGSLADCSVYDSTDADDVLYVQMRDRSGNPIASGSSIADGDAITETWESFGVDFTDDIDLVSRAGEDVQVYFYATHDQDERGTWFYLDKVECNVCTYWPIPPEEPGTASIGGLVRTVVGGVPQPLPGVDVMAYSRGGEVYRTRTIHDGTYHFYNILPATYFVYAETPWSGGLRTASARVTVAAGERNYDVNLLLQ